MTELRCTRGAFRVLLFVRLCLLLGLLVLSTAHPAMAGDFYAQPPVTEKELTKFIEDLPLYRAWARSEKELAHPALSETGRPAFVYSAKVAARVQTMGWTPERFFCVMGRTAAALAIQEQGIDARERPMDMPVVSPKEFDLVRRHKQELLAAGKDPAPH